MKDLIQKICEEANVTPDQAKAMLLILQEHVRKNYPLLSPMINKAFANLDEKVSKLSSSPSSPKSKEDEEEDFLH